jgi:hypothetical protein
MEKSKRNAPTVVTQPGPVYFFGGLGALIYYIQISDGFWEVVLAFLKSIVWPAFLTHDLLAFLAR